MVWANPTLALACAQPNMMITHDEWCKWQQCEELTTGCLVALCTAAAAEVLQLPNQQAKQWLAGKFTSSILLHFQSIAMFDG